LDKFGPKKRKASGYQKLEEARIYILPTGFGRNTLISDF
jgi:hypothetical protein